MPNNPSVNVFAYGSNLHLNRMRNRAPSAEVADVGYVAGRKIDFRKRSVDGSAKADAKFTGNHTDRLWGVVYRLSPQDKRELDKYEFLGIGYDELLVDVWTISKQKLSALVYVARNEAIDESLEPFSWYVDFVREGATQHRLPFCYINQELFISSVADPDPNRQQLNLQILAALDDQPIND